MPSPAQSLSTSGRRMPTSPAWKAAKSPDPASLSVTECHSDCRELLSASRQLRENRAHAATAAGAGRAACGNRPRLCARYVGLGEPPAARPGRLAAPARSRHVRRRSPLRPARIQGDQNTLRLTSSHTSLTDESAREHTRASDLDNRCCHGPRRNFRRRHGSKGFWRQARTCGRRLTQALDGPFSLLGRLKRFVIGPSVERLSEPKDPGALVPTNLRTDRLRTRTPQSIMLSYMSVGSPFIDGTPSSEK